MKQCKICEEYFPATPEHFHKNSKSQDGLFSYCKPCVKLKSTKYRNENIERSRETSRKWKENNRERNLDYLKSYHRENREAETKYLNDWQQNNKDKVVNYRTTRGNKKHEISKEEWESCKNYFNYECAYCGVSEEEHKQIHNQQLHKEHVDHNGSNGIDNCVPSCKSCNGSKGTKGFDDWYNYDNPNFTVERFERIIDWLNDDFYEFIKGE